MNPKGTPRRRENCITRGLLLLIGLLTWGGDAHAQPGLPSPLGPQTVLVIVCSYSGSLAPTVSDVTWAARLNASVRPYYAAATATPGAPGGMTTVTFVPFSTVGGAPVVPLPYTLAQTAPGGSASPVPAGGGFGVFDASNDPATIPREGRNALDAADAVGTGLFGGPSGFTRVLVFVNGPKRGRAMTVVPYLGNDAATPGGRRLFNLSVSVMSETDPAAVSTVAHEFGHFLGLPDLYKEPSLPIPGGEFTESWCQMGNHTMQNFSGLSRFLMGWVTPPRIMTIGAPPAGVTVTTPPITLRPPLTGAGTELILIPSASTLPAVPTPPGFPPAFSGLMVEARPRTGLDARLPDGYVGGVIVSKIKPGVPGVNFPPLNPMVIMPRSRIPPPEPSNKRQLRSAAFLPTIGASTSVNTFTDPETGTTVRVTGSAAGGGFNVVVTRTTPPRPEVVAFDAWLDSPVNGAAFLTPPLPNGDPSLFGDQVTSVRVIQIAPGPPPSLTDTETFPPHTLSVRVVNRGSAAAVGVRGKVLIFQPQLPVLPQIAAPTPATFAAVLDALKTALSPTHELGVSFGTVAGGGGTGVATATFTPGGPFAAVLVLERAASPTGVVESEVVDNIYFEPFVVRETTFASPYAPVEQAMPVRNGDETGHLVFVTPVGVPPGWKARFSMGGEERSYAVLDRGRAQEFRLRLEPGDPAREKPGQIKEVNLLAWMNYADSWIPAYRTSLYTVLSHSTQLSLRPGSKSRDSVTVEGRLTYRTEGGQLLPARQQPVVVGVYGMDGSSQVIMPGRPGHTARTDSDGSFSQTIRINPRVRYFVLAEYGGSVQYGKARSPQLTLGL